MTKAPLLKLLCPYIFSMLCLSYAQCPLISASAQAFILMFSLAAIVWAEFHLNKRFRSLNLYLQMIILGFYSYQRALHFQSEPEISALSGQYFMVLTISEIIMKKDKTQVIAHAEFHGKDPCNMMPFGYKVNLLFNDKVDLQTGNRIMTYGYISRFTANRNPQAFDYKKYMARHGLHFQAYINQDDWIKVDSAPSFHLATIADRGRMYIFNILQQALNKEQNLSIISAMLLGIRSLIDEHTKFAFQKTGAVHVLAVSGLHVGIISGICVFLLSLFKWRAPWFKYVRLCILIAMVWTFVLLCGAPASVVRAATMFSIYYFGMAMSRSPDIYNIIAFAAFMMLLIDPINLYDIGFQFSFLALTSIVYFFNKIESWLYIPNKLLRKIWQLIVLSISAQILVFPLAIYYFHMFSNYFWLSGIFVVPLAAISIMVSLSMLMASILHCKLLTSLLAAALNYILDAFRFVIAAIERLPLACFTDLHIDGSAVLLIYICIICFIIWLESGRIKMAAVGLLCYFCFICMQWRAKQKAWSHIEFCVYDIYKNSLVDIFHKANAYQYASHTISDMAIKYNASNHRLSYYVDPESLIDLSHRDSLIFAFKAKNILLFPSSAMLLKKGIELDYLILNKSGLRLLPHFLNTVKIKCVVFDSSITKLNDATMVLLSSYHTAHYHTLESGAFIIPLNP